MSSKHYDIAIIGGSLAAHIAAALLAKRGSKVLFIRNREDRAPAWFHSSIFLEKLLGVLGGRSCFVAQRPIQVLSEKTRLTISNDVPLEDELFREFGTTGTAVGKWLSELQGLGTRLEDLFWENGGLPWPALKAAGRFKLLCLRRRINWQELDNPVSQAIESMPEPSRAFLTDLLQGLSLTETTNLSYAQAAMLWAQALRPENLVEPDFSNMLNKRFEQFHGAKESIEDLDSLDFDGSRWSGGKFKSGSSFTADNFLLGDKKWLNKFSALQSSQLPIPPAPKTFRTSNLSDQLSPLLATRIICGGKLPLRLAIEDNDNELQGLALSSSGATQELIRSQLEPALPFAKFHFSEENPAETAVEKKADQVKLSKLSNVPIRIEKNLYCADRSVLLPEMGAAGAALLGWTLAENLGKKNEQSKK